LILMVDWNKRQLDGYLDQVCKPLSLTDKFEAFGLSAQTVIGYDVESIYEGIINAKKNKDRPSVIILDTYKGIGISFAESMLMNHYISVNKTMMQEAIDEIECRYANGTYPGGESK
jgi:transketolase